jgi:hypothetical protein
MGKPMNTLPSKLYLIGGGDGKKDAPFDGERWGVNATCLGVPVNLSFHIHDLEHPELYRITGTTDKQADFEPFLSYVKMTNHPVLSMKEYPDFPSIKAYPYEEVCDFFNTNFFSNSICYMLAYALFRGYKDITLYGFNFALANEYKDELPGMHYWLGVANAMGLIPGKNFRILGNHSSIFHCVDGNSKKYRVSYSYGEPLRYVPEELPISITPHYGGDT